jgi:hypothetical protein
LVIGLIFYSVIAYNHLVTILGIKGKESITVHKFLEDLGNVLRAENRMYDWLRAEKGTSLRRPELGKCTLNLLDEQFSSVELTYFSEDWSWGEPHESMRGTVFLSKVILRNPVKTSAKGGAFGLLGDYPVKEKTGFMKTSTVGYQFRPSQSDSVWLAERINSDRGLLDALNKEFSTGKGRPLPKVGNVSGIEPFGGFDVFDVDGHKEKVAATDFWKIKAPDTAMKLVQRLNVLRRLAVYLQGPGAAPPPLQQHLAKRTVLWDMAHHETLRVAFQKVVEMLQTSNIPWGPIGGEWQERCLAEEELIGWPATLVLGGIESDGKLATAEINNIVKFVEAGGSLLITAPRSLYSFTDTNKLSSQFGFTFPKGKIEDSANHEGKHKDYTIIRDFKNHPITEGIKEVCFGDYGGTIIKPEKDDVKLLAFTSDKATSPKAPVLAYVSKGKGAVVAFACSTTFDDNTIGKLDNLKFAKNIFEYLSTMETANKVQPSMPHLPPPPPPPPPPPD